MSQNNVYNATPATRTIGEINNITETDAVGNAKVTLGTLIEGEDSTNNVLATVPKPVAKPDYAPSVYNALTLVTKANVKATTGNVFSVHVTNDNAAVRYFQLHNKATAPAAAEVPVEVFKIPAGTANNPGVLSLDESHFARGGSHFTTGIGFAISTTLGTFTDSATASEHLVNIKYI